MSNITVIPSGGGGGTTFNKREVYVGPASTTFTAASDGLVEVNCWGGGGNGGEGSGCGGGGGGGYVRYVYDLSAGDSLSITVGGQGGTSSVTCPSQSPTSPISATGGSDGSATSPSPSPTNSVTPGGAGGSGSGTVPSPRAGLLWTADGGQGSPGNFAPAYGSYYGGGGGCAGSEFGDGVDNTNPPTGPTTYNNVLLGGAGVGGKAEQTGSPQPQVYTENNPISPDSAPPAYPPSSPYLETDYTYYGKGGPGSTVLGAPPAGVTWSPWFYSYEQIGGSGGNGIQQYTPGPSPTTYNHRPAVASGSIGGFMAGGAGGHRPGPGTQFYNKPMNKGYPGGIAGGGGGMGQITPSNPGPTSFGSGGVGLVIIYYTI